VQPRLAVKANPSTKQNVASLEKETSMFNNPARVSIIAMLAAVVLYSVSVLFVAMFAGFILVGPGYAQGSAPNLSGTYRCSPEPSQCQAPTFSVSQTGPSLEIKADNGPVAEGKLTSDITVSAGPPWNANGVVMPDRSIQWSDGTHWRKQ
jgi:hypothetical protein